MKQMKLKKKKSTIPFLSLIRSGSCGFGNQSSRFEVSPVNNQPRESSLTNETNNYRSTPPLSANHSPKIPMKSILKPAAQFTSYSPNSVVTQGM